MFVLAHISDPHLAPATNPHWSELLGKRATGFANWRASRHRVHRPESLARVVADLKAHNPDHIAVTGDLVNISASGEYAPARAWLGALGSAEAVTLVPGNHDIYVPAAVRQPHCHWGDYMRGDGSGELTFPFLRRRNGVALIGLSSAIPTLAFSATGRVGHEQIARAMEMLERCRREQLFRVVLVHHPPLSARPHRLRRLIDAAQLREALACCGAELVLHGHDHVHSLSMLEGRHRTIPIVGVPSASLAQSAHHGRAGYNLYYIAGPAGAWQCEVVARGLTAEGTMADLKRTMLQL